MAPLKYRGCTVNIGGYLGPSDFRMLASKGGLMVRASHFLTAKHNGVQQRYCQDMTSSWLHHDLLQAMLVRQSLGTGNRDSHRCLLQQWLSIQQIQANDSSEWFKLDAWCYLPNLQPSCFIWSYYIWFWVDLPLWKIWVRQLGWWLFPIYGKS